MNGLVAQFQILFFFCPVKNRPKSVGLRVSTGLALISPLMMAVADDAKAGADMDSSGAFLLHVCSRERFRIDGFRKAAPALLSCLRRLQVPSIALERTRGGLGVSADEAAV